MANSQINKIKIVPLKKEGIWKKSWRIKEQEKLAL